jgi:hypothetical protein
LIEDYDGVFAALYPIRELQSKQKISRTISVRDRNGNQRTLHLTVKGPVCIAGCTTKEPATFCFFILYKSCLGGFLQLRGKALANRQLAIHYFGRRKAFVNCPGPVTVPQHFVFLFSISLV